MYGTGTEDNPYDGTITELDDFAYYALGASFNVDAPSGSITPGFGLYIEDGSLRGTLIASGVCEYMYMDGANIEYCTLAVCHEFQDNSVISEISGQLQFVLGIPGNMDEIVVDVDPPNQTELAVEMGSSGLYEFDLHCEPDAIQSWESLVSFLERMGLDYYNLSFDYDETSEILHVATGLLTNNWDSTYWTPTVTVVDGHASFWFMEVQEIYQEKDLYMNDIIPEPTKEGYTFAGWSETTDHDSGWGQLTDSNWLDDAENIKLLCNPVRFLFPVWIPEIEIGTTFSEGDFIYRLVSNEDVEISGPVDEITGNVNIPETVVYNGKIYQVVSIADRAFFQCNEITSLNIPATVTSIGDAAFAGCTSISVVHFESSYAPTVGSGSFATNSIVQVTTAGWNPLSIMNENSLKYTKEDGFYMGTAMWANPPEQTVGTEFEYDGLTYVFISKTTVEVTGYSTEPYKRISIPETAVYEATGYAVVSIGTEAFRGCIGISDVDIPTTVRSIGEGAFRECTELDFLTIPGYVIEVGDFAFQGCTSLSFVNLNPGTENIGVGAFEECIGLSYIRIPDSISYIGANAFYGCSLLTSMTFDNSTPPAMGQYSFATGTTLAVKTPGWNPVSALVNAIDNSTNVIWSNPLLCFTSNPATDGIVTWI